jgi:hypothetical protein
MWAVRWRAGSTSGSDRRSQACSPLPHVGEEPCRACWKYQPPTAAVASARDWWVLRRMSAVAGSRSTCSSRTTAQQGVSRGTQGPRTQLCRAPRSDPRAVTGTPRSHPNTGPTHLEATPTKPVILRSVSDAPSRHPGEESPLAQPKPRFFPWTPFPPGGSSSVEGLRVPYGRSE